MSITFDQVDGVIQRASDTPAEAPPTAQDPAPPPDHHRLLAETARIQQRRDRLRAD